MPRLDAIDRRILGVLSVEGRLSTVDVAERVGLSPTPCGRRIRELEKAGVIEGYAARLDSAALGLTVCVMVSVRLDRHHPDGHAQFVDAVRQRPEITECLLVTGSYDYLLRIWLSDVAALADFVSKVLQGIPGVGETSTMVVLAAPVTRPLI
ncbi:Lrp/AsnC family transcriptional regulator [Sphingomonas sp. KR1UV-12]|uniref:Lrp/AsnC family transcriptional regulator n=1 Tax=Sphingomonas aurea TaxID=3063994 RepID=A0ABT9ENB6_9SPHN|nr:Lrp/AsnC family transcriptional regulator [Sphingomonas sp. KR1UV-12]MDP1028148.1 Lrp/AsnC family transcriptional regulator [Sphingomonas sp. KR1UV-12]